MVSISAFSLLIELLECSRSAVWWTNTWFQPFSMPWSRLDELENDIFEPARTTLESMNLTAWTLWMTLFNIFCTLILFAITRMWAECGQMTQAKKKKRQSTSHKTLITNQLSKKWSFFFPHVPSCFPARSFRFLVTFFLIFIFPINFILRSTISDHLFT